MTVNGLLEVGEPDHIAIADQNGLGITYQSLRATIQQIHSYLAAQGLSRTDVVASVLRNGPDAAIMFLALSSYCGVAPVNPAYLAGEIEFGLRDMEARLLITSQDLPEAVAAGAQCGVPTISASDLMNRAASQPLTYTTHFPKPDDIALLLHTSGTTGRPKQVGLTHRNLCLSTRGVLEVLCLKPEDRCLLVMPLFHVHGLVAGLLATIASGATVCCPLGFQAVGFCAMLISSQATWYTAVPTMHQAILARVPRNTQALAAHKLRFIRSASSMLYPQVVEKLESAFGVPVLNAYGMTEAAHQISCTRLPGLGDTTPRTSVGHSTGPEIAVLNASSQFAKVDERGEVLLRGEQIISRYLHPEGANETGFWQGWFRTGDEGYIDASGALVLTGRLKEIINCGGEKISPFEIEEALLLEPAIAQAVAFAVPHPMLGEEVGAAVVIKEGAVAVERSLIEAISRKLARHKVPRSIQFVTEIPKGATGKIQRIGMAERLLGLKVDS